MTGVFQPNVFQNNVFQVGGSSPPPTTGTIGCGFQCSAFQPSAFQDCCGAAVIGAPSHGGQFPGMRPAPLPRLRPRRPRELITDAERARIYREIAEDTYRMGMGPKPPTPVIRKILAKAAVIEAEEESPVLDFIIALGERRKAGEEIILALEMRILEQLVLDLAWAAQMRADEDALTVLLLSSPV